MPKVLPDKNTHILFYIIINNQTEVFEYYVLIVFRFQYDTKNDKYMVMSML